LQQLINAWVTCVAVLIHNRCLYIASCGDCRAFLLRSGDAKRISIVHTGAEFLLEQGSITLEELTRSIYDAQGPIRALGYNGDSGMPDLRMRFSSNYDKQINIRQGVELQAGDQIVLSSGRIFGDYITAEGWQQFQTVFFSPDLSAQEAVDQFIKPYRNFNNVSDMTVIALRHLPNKRNQ
jgi:serine/threonine protein phosphatase PrpC